MRRLLVAVALSSSGCFLLGEPSDPPAEVECRCGPGQVCGEGGCVDEVRACASDAQCAADAPCVASVPQEGCVGAACPLPLVCGAPGAPGAVGLLRCETAADCRSALCVGQVCVQPCEGASCPEGFTCAPRVVEGGWSVQACSGVDGDEGLSLCRRDADCADGRRCEALRPHMDPGPGEAIPSPFVCREGARETPPAACGEGTACERGLCAGDCSASSSASLCGLSRCATPCADHGECAPGFVCRGLLEGDPGSEHRICAPPSGGGCVTDAYCCTLSQGACAPDDNLEVCAVVPDGERVAFRCRPGEDRAPRGADCADHAACATGLCLDGACATPADPEGVRPCLGLGERVTTESDGVTPLPFDLVAACTYGPPRAPCSHDGDCCRFVKELQSCPRDPTEARCVLDGAAASFLCETPSGAVGLGLPCAAAADCVTGLCLDGLCAGPAPLDERRCPLPGLRTSVDAAGAPLPHGLAEACSYAPSCWFGASTDHDEDLRSCLRAPATLTLEASIEVADWPTGDQLCARLGQGPCRAVFDFGCAVMDCDATVEAARAVRCDCAAP